MTNIKNSIRQFLWALLFAAGTVACESPGYNNEDQDNEHALTNVRDEDEVSFSESNEEAVTNRWQNQLTEIEQLHLLVDNRIKQWEARDEELTSQHRMQLKELQEKREALQQRANELKALDQTTEADNINLEQELDRQIEEVRSAYEALGETPGTEFPEGRK